MKCQENAKPTNTRHIILHHNSARKWFLNGMGSNNNSNKKTLCLLIMIVTKPQASLLTSIKEYTHTQNLL